MFGSVIWAGLVLIVLVSILESYDPHLAMLLVTVTFFALFIAHADQIIAILNAAMPRP